MTTNGSSEPLEFVNGGSEEALSSWQNGDEGVVVSVEEDSRFGIRLQELGALPDARIRMLLSGSPIVIQIEDGRFCIRSEDADKIRVRRLPGVRTG